MFQRFESGNHFAIVQMNIGGVVVGFKIENVS
jgi:hypothetical protein